MNSSSLPKLVRIPLNFKNRKNLSVFLVLIHIIIIMIIQGKSTLIHNIASLETLNIREHAEV